MSTEPSFPGRQSRLAFCTTQKGTQKGPEGQSLEFCKKWRESLRFCKMAGKSEICKMAGKLEILRASNQKDTCPIGGKV